MKIGKTWLNIDSRREANLMNYQIYQIIIELEGNIYPQIRYAIRDENENLVRHSNKSFFATQREAEQNLCEIVQKRLEEGG